MLERRKAKVLRAVLRGGGDGNAASLPDYRTEHGAAIGDLLMSLIGTCRMNNVSEWSYLLALVEHAREVRREPSRWLPWNYQPHEMTRQAA